MEKNVMSTPQLVQFLKLLMDKGMTPERWTGLASNPAFAAMFDARADLSNPAAVIAALGMEIKKSRQAGRKILAGLLELIGEPVKLPACTRFVARDKFVKNTDATAELLISYMGENFHNNFLDVVEKNVKPATLKQRKLLNGSVDTPILSALGDKDPGNIKKAKTALAHVHNFLKTADSNRWYIFYVADKNGTVRAVFAYWSGGGWFVSASAVADPSGWNVNRVVVSR